MSEMAVIEWGQSWTLGESHRASILTFAMREDLELVVVRWDEKFPHWWSHGEVDENAEWVEKLILELEKEVGRRASRVLTFSEPLDL